MSEILCRCLDWKFESQAQYVLLSPMYKQIEFLLFSNLDIFVAGWLRREEAEYSTYCTCLILPLFPFVPVKRLAVCDELEHSSCGSLLFYCRIDPPVFDLMPTGEEVNHTPQPQLPLGLKTGEQ